MPQVKARQLREKSVEELREQERTLREQLFKLRFQTATGQAESPQKIGLVRRELARVLTVLGERPEAPAEAPAGSAETGRG